MKKFFHRKAQSITDYVLLVGIISAALLGLQVYMKRGIQANIKVVADKMGEQKKGGLERDYKYEWKIKTGSSITSIAEGTSTVRHDKEGAVTYGKDDTTTQSGVLSGGVLWERE